MGQRVLLRATTSFRFALFVLVMAFASTSFAQTSAFTYQGRLTDGASPANGTFQMEFKVFDALSAGTQIGSTITNGSVVVTGGLFTVNLDFSPATPFATGASRWLEIGVKKAAEPSFTVLSPRQQITSSPYSVRTINAGAADGLSAACVGCVTNAQIDGIAGSKVSGAVASATAAASAGNVTGTVAITNGGTGATSAASARANLGLGTLATQSPTGTANATTFLRGDNTWATAGGAGAAIVDLIATKTTAQSLAIGGNAVVPDNVSFNNVLTAPSIPGAAFDGTTYTVGQTGFYLITVSVMQNGATIVGSWPQLLVNGTTVVYGVGSQNGNLQTGTWGRGSLSAVIQLTAGQSVTIKVANTSVSATQPLSTDGSTRISIVKF